MNIRQLLKLDLTSCCGQTLVINNAGRIRWIDQLRGLAILFVFFAHGGGWHPVFEYVMMPIFFFLSGYLHKDKSNFVQFVKRIVLRIYIPYVFFCSIRTVMHILTSHDIEFYARELVESLIFGTSNIWFFPCLISVEILAFLTDKLPLRGRLPQLVLTMGGVIMLFACIENSCLPWRMDTALSMMPIFYLGFFYKKVEQKDGWNNKYVSLLLLLIYISIIWFVMSFGYNVNVSVNHYGSPIMFILLAPVGLYVYTHFVKSCNIGAYFSSIGKNTILLYGINLQLIQVAGFVFTKIPLAVNPYFVNTVMCVCATLIGLLISIPINKYLPFVVGNKIKK